MVQLLAFALLAALDQPEKVFFRDKHTSFFAGASLTKNIRFITLTPGCPTKFFDVKQEGKNNAFTCEGEKQPVPIFADNFQCKKGKGTNIVLAFAVGDR